MENKCLFCRTHIPTWEDFCSAACWDAYHILHAEEQEDMDAR